MAIEYVCPAQHQRQQNHYQPSDNPISERFTSVRVLEGRTLSVLIDLELQYHSFCFITHSQPSTGLLGTANGAQWMLPLLGHVMRPATLILTGYRLAISALLHLYNQSSCCREVGGPIPTNEHTSGGSGIIVWPHRGQRHTADPAHLTALVITEHRKVRVHIAQMGSGVNTV